MATNIPSITPLPPPPSTSNPAAFDQLADTFVQSLQGLSSELATTIPAINASAGEIEARTAAAVAAARTAVNAPGSASTSASSHSLSLGDKTFAVEAGKAWAAGQVVNIVRTAAPASARMQAVVTAYTSSTGALAVAVIPGTILGGSGATFTDWTITLAGSAAPMVVVDRAYAEQLGYNSLVPLMPHDSRPQRSQGTEILAAELTPKSVTNRIRVKVVVPWSCSDTTQGRTGCAAVFVNGEAAAKFTAYEVLPFDGFAGILTLEREFVAGTLSSILVTVRVGCNWGNFLLFGNRFAPFGDGSQAATLILEEITA